MDNKTYYEGFDWDKAKLEKKLQDKIDLIKNNIPKEVNTILDVGCGNGVISNGLSTDYFVTAVDRSINALKYVKLNKINASAEKLPFRENSFDLVFSSEMIEHLPENIFQHAINEMKRVSKKYVFLTFPNNENIEKQITECPRCSYRFNKSYHLRSLNLEIIKRLFPEYSIVKTFDYGLKVRDYNKFLSKLKHRYTPPTAWIPPNWTRNHTRKTMCPNCGYEFEIPYKFNLFAFGLDMLNIILSKKRPYQICVLLEKKIA